MLDDRDAAVVFSFGTNDVIQGVPAEESLRVFERAIIRCDANGLARCFVAPPAIHGLPAADAQLGELVCRTSTICDMRDVRRISARELLPEDGQWYAQAAAFDGAHPQADGYAELARALVDAGLAKWLTENADR